MKISDELFADVRRTLGLPEPEEDAPVPASAGSAGSAGGAGDAADRRVRRVEAAEVSAAVEIEPFGQVRTKRRSVALYDIGVRGIGFTDDRPWAAGEKCIVHLPRSSGKIIPLICTVRNCKCFGEQFRIGGEFTDQSEIKGPSYHRSTEGITSLQGTPTVPRTQTGRRAPRKQMAGTESRASLHADDDRGLPAVFESEIVDISDSGVGVITYCALLPDEVVLVRLCPTDGKAITRLCAVVYSRPIDGARYRIGLKFIGPRVLGRVMPRMLYGWFKK